MKKGILLLFVFTFSSVFAQQNLVPNYSFEQKLQCINGYGEFNGYVADWTGQGFGVGWGSGLIWYTEQCFSNGYAAVPRNATGYQYAHSGVSYISIVSFLNDGSTNDTNFRNYIQVELNSPLIIGEKYCVVFYVSLANICEYACNDIGAYFSDSALNNSPTCRVKSSFIPQIANDPINNPLTDTLNWTKIMDNFIAAGGERYIIIGNFKNDANSSITSVNSNFPSIGDDELSAVYYVDDVYVLEIMQAHAGRDTLICNGDRALIGKDTGTPGVGYRWSPTAGLLNPNTPQTFASPTVTTTYTLTVINDSMETKSCGCPDSLTTDSVTIRVCNDVPQQACGEVFVPNVFSPSESVNNILYVKGDCIATMDFMVFDRWGNKVFESQNLNDGWDGIYRGHPMDMATYVWYLKATLNDGTSVEKKGNVTLVR